MTMLAILIAYVLERALNNIDHYRTYQWYNLFCSAFLTRLRHTVLWSDTVAVLLMLFIPVFILAYLDHLLAKITLIEFLFSITILLYCLGPKDVHEAARKFIDARHRDDQVQAREYAEEILGQSIPEEDSRLFSDISRTILVAANDRILGVFFWFILLGPMGALMYRLSNQLMRQPSTRADPDSIGMIHTARILYAIINWIPSHLTALCYALIGSFIDALHEWKIHKSFDPFNPDECEHMLVRTGLASLRMDSNSITFDESSLKHILEMSWRTTLAWLTVLALITMAGWAS